MIQPFIVFLSVFYSQLMAHGPSIMVLPVKPFHRILFIWVILLEGSRIMRIAANFLAEFELRKWAGVLNGIVILAFFINMAILLAIEVCKAKQKRQIKTIIELSPT